MNKLKDLIGSILKENYKNFDKKTDETNADIGTLGKDGTTNLIEKIRTELTNLRKFIGYDIIDTVDGETGQYKFEKTNYDSVFGYTSNLKDGEVKTLLDYIKIFVSDKTDQNNAIKNLQDTVASINSSLTQLESNLKECAKNADLSKYVDSQTLTTELSQYAEKTELNGFASENDVTAIKNDLKDNYYDKDYIDSKLTTVSSGMVKFDNSTDTYDFTLENNGTTDITLNFSTSYQSIVKFVKVNGIVCLVDPNTGNFGDNNKIPNGSLVQIGYKNGGKLAITEPVWVEIITAGMGGGKSVDVTHSI